MEEVQAKVSYNDIVGHDTPKKVLSSIVKSYEDSPRIIVISGQDGVGKTMMSRAFINDLRDNTCFGGHSLSFYKEINANSIQNEEDLAQLETSSVICIEYFEDLSFYLQSKLLDIIDKSSNKFYILCTNNTSKVLAAIKNRAMPIDLAPLSDDEIKDRLAKMREEGDLDLSKDETDKIVLRARGSMREVLSLINKRKLLGEELFNTTVFTSREALIKFLIASFVQDKDNAEKTLIQLSIFPLLFIKDDYEALTLEILKVGAKAIDKTDKYIKTLFSFASSKVLDLFNIMNNKILYDMFDTEDNFKSAMWYIYIQIGKIIK